MLKGDKYIKIRISTDDRKGNGAKLTNGNQHPLQCEKIAIDDAELQLPVLDQTF